MSRLLPLHQTRDALERMDEYLESRAEAACDNPDETPCDCDSCDAAIQRGFVRAALDELDARRL